MSLRRICWLHTVEAPQR